jgi:2-iminobutanoate/2-iminopropanoate deaminase
MVQQKVLREPITLPSSQTLTSPLTVPAVKSGNLIFLSAVRGTDKGLVYLSGDPREQARRCFENMASVLGAAGASLGHVAKVTVYFSDFRWLPAFDEVWAETFPDNPPARLMLKAANASDDPMGNAYFVLDVVAVQPGQETRQVVPRPAGAPPLDPHTAGAVVAGGFVFFSSVRGADESSSVYLPSDPKKQVERAYENMRLYLQATGGSLDQLVRMIIHFDDLKYRDGFNALWAEIFPKNRPARSALTAADANEHPEGNAHFVLDAIGVAPGYPTRQEFYVAPGGAMHGAGNVSGTVANGMLFCGAMRGGVGNVYFDSDPRVQAERAFINLAKTMEGAGVTLDNVAKATVHFEDLQFLGVFNDKWRETFPANPPALTELQAGSANHTPLSNAYFVLDVTGAAL